MNPNPTFLAFRGPHKSHIINNHNFNMFIHFLDITLDIFPYIPLRGSLRNPHRRHVPLADAAGVQILGRGSSRLPEGAAAESVEVESQEVVPRNASSESASSQSFLGIADASHSLGVVCVAQPSPQMRPEVGSASSSSSAWEPQTA